MPRGEWSVPRLYKKNSQRSVTEARKGNRNSWSLRSDKHRSDSMNMDVIRLRGRFLLGLLILCGSGLILIFMRTGEGEVFALDGASSISTQGDPTVAAEARTSPATPVAAGTLEPPPVELVGSTRKDVGGLASTPVNPLKAGQVRVQVVDHEGLPVRSAKVRMFKSSTKVLAQPSRLIGDPGASRYAGYTDANGEVVINVNRAGKWIAWAGTARTFFERSAPLELESGGSAVCERLVLMPIPDNQRMEGLVLAPDGSPVRRPAVSLYTERDGELSVVSAMTTAVDGEFVLRSELPIFSGPDERKLLVARDHDKQLRACTSDVARFGQHDLRLQLSPPQMIAVHIWGDGRVVNYACKVTLEVERLGHWSAIQSWKPSYRETIKPIAFLQPAETFRLKVSARDFHAEEFGPFEPDVAPLQLRLDLETLARVQGRVLAMGKPLSGATVKIDGHQWGGGSTDSDGRYSITCGREGARAVNVSHPRLGALDPDIVEIPRTGVVDASFSYAGMATLSGVVLLEKNERTEAGSKVLWLYHQSQKQSSSIPIAIDGSIAATPLAAGTWIASLNNPVHSHSPEFASDMQTGEVRIVRQSDAQSGTIKFEIEEGAKQEITFDFREAPKCILKGRLRLDYRREWGSIAMCGNGLSSPFVRLEESDGSFPVGQSGLVSVGFELAAREPGSYSLSGMLKVGAYDELFISKELELKPGENRVDMDLQAGRLRMQMSPRDPAAARKLVVEWRDNSGLLVVCSTNSGSMSSDCDATSVVPPGRVEIYWKEEDQKRRMIGIADVGPDEEVLVVLDHPQPPE